MLKEVLPHRGELIDQCGFACYDSLLEEIEEKLLQALRQMNEAEELDNESVASATRILRIVNAVARDFEGRGAEAPNP